MTFSGVVLISLIKNLEWPRCRMISGDCFCLILMNNYRSLFVQFIYCMMLHGMLSSCGVQVGAAAVADSNGDFASLRCRRSVHLAVCGYTGTVDGVIVLFVLVQASATSQGVSCQVIFVSRFSRQSRKRPQEPTAGTERSYQRLGTMAAFSNPFSRMVTSRDLKELEKTDTSTNMASTVE